MFIIIANANKVSDSRYAIILLSSACLWNDKCRSGGRVETDKGSASRIGYKTRTYDHMCRKFVYVCGCQFYCDKLNLTTYENII